VVQPARVRDRFDEPEFLSSTIETGTRDEELVARKNVGASLVDDGHGEPVEDFDEHVKAMQGMSRSGALAAMTGIA